MEAKDGREKSFDNSFACNENYPNLLRRRPPCPKSMKFQVRRDDVRVFTTRIKSSAKQCRQFRNIIHGKRTEIAGNLNRLAGAYSFVLKITLHMYDRTGYHVVTQWRFARKRQIIYDA